MSDNQHIWRPFTIIQDAPTIRKVVKGEGVWLELEDGTRIIDAVSSWWVNILGHSNPVIAEAIFEQAKTLEHVIFAGFSHDPAEKLADILAEKLPGSLNRVFFSDNGSTAVEVGMKAAYQYWKNKGENRKTFICFEGAYHGDTIGAMSGSARSEFSEVFKELMFDVEFLPYPETWMGDETIGHREDEIINILEEKLDKDPDRYAGILIEPLVQGAGGMRMCRSEFLQKLHWVNRQFGTLLIFDEVMTGFGRTGDWFASIRAQVEPDIICLSKGITGGFLPLSVTVVSDEIYEAFNSADPVKTFWHGHSYTANPLGCAAAVASAGLLEKNTMFQEMEHIHKEEIAKLMDHPKLEKFRITGTIAAMNIVNDEDTGYFNSAAKRIKEECVHHGVLIRPLGNVLYLMPPYVITEEELRSVYAKIPILLEGN